MAVEVKNILTVKTKIEISAIKSKVCGIIVDVDKWKKWNPTNNASEGTASLGASLRITMMSDKVDKDAPKYSPTIIKFEEQKNMYWRAHMLTGFIFTNDKIIELKEMSSGTKVIYAETFKDLLTPKLDIEQIAINFLIG